MNQLLTLANLTPALRRTLLKDAYTLTQTSSPTKLKKAVGLDTRTPMGDVYAYLVETHNAVFDAQRAESIRKSIAHKEMKQKEKEKKNKDIKIRKQLTGYLQRFNDFPIAPSRVRGQSSRKVGVHINITENVLWIKSKKSYIQQSTIYETFDIKSTLELKAKIELYMYQSYPWSDDYKEITLIEYNYKIHQDNIKKVNKMDVPMRSAKPYIGSFLHYMDKVSPVSLQDGNGECVLMALCNHWKVKGKPMNKANLREEFNNASIAVYHTPYLIKTGITARMILYVCKKLNISCLGFDQDNNLFLKFTNDHKKAKNYKAIIFYMFLNHFYLVDDEETARHLSQCFKDSTVIKTDLQMQKEQKKEKYETVFYPNMPVADALELPAGAFIIYDTITNLNDELKEYIEITNDAKPKMKYGGLASLTSFTSKNNITFAISGCMGEGVNWQDIRKICEHNDIAFKNQSFGSLILQLKNKFNEKKRVKFTQEQRDEIAKKNNNLCPSCNNALEKSFHIDHIRPLSNGGTNDDDNLQALCATCHRDKCRQEQEACDYIERDDVVSSFNIHNSKLLQSNYFRKVAFTERIGDLNKKRKLFGVDINKCRRNILNYSTYKWCVFSVLDNIEPFDGYVKDGFYYVECENKFPLRGNIFYTRPMVEYAMSQGLITHENIKYQILPSFTLKEDYFKELIAHLLDCFKENPQLQKLSINSLVGLYGRRKNEFVQHKICNRNDKDDVASAYQDLTRPYINEINDDLVSITGNVSIEKLESAFPIHSQVLDMEAIELHKMTRMIEKAGGVPIILKTDCVIYHAKKAIDINNYYWDNNQSVRKYKEEDYIEASVIPIKITNTDRLEIKQEEYNVLIDNDDIINQIINSNKGCLILGSAGTGKTYLINKLVEALNGKTILRVAPTNVSAILIKGQTLDKFAHSFMNSNNNKFNNLEYIFVDEISMVRVLFYQLLLSVKLMNPKVKIIISGDFFQLPPVEDRVKGKVYETSRALWELVDGNILNLTKCKRSDDTLFNICESVKFGRVINPKQFGNLKTLKNLSFTNATRKIVNAECAEIYMTETKGRIVKIEKLYYDDNSQEYNLMEGMPVIARINQKSLGIVNNEMYKVKRIKGDTVIFENGIKDVEIKTSSINRTFNIAFCLTVHKSQGQTFNEPYTIYEWGRMDSTLRYVALSRATEKEYINIV